MKNPEIGDFNSRPEHDKGVDDTAVSASRKARIAQAAIAVSVLAYSAEMSGGLRAGAATEELEHISDEETAIEVFKLPEGSGQTDLILKDENR